MLYRGFKYKPSRYPDYLDSEEFGLTVKSVNIPLVASNRTTSESVLGRDTQYDFTDGYNKKQVALRCELHNSINYAGRKAQARQIVEWLYEPGQLILNYEADKYYEARLIEQIDVEMLTVYDTFTLVFEVDATQKSTYENSDITWETADIIWSGAEITWNMLDLETAFTGVTTGAELTVKNLGNYEALPIISLSGTAASVTLTDDKGNSFTYGSLNGTIYIDCDNKLVYSVSGDKVNQRSNFAGDYIKLLAGTNTIDVTGTITSLDISFDFKNTYI